MELTNLSTIKALMSKHNMSFSKSLGQNFLTNPSVSPRIAEYGGAGAGVGVIEIGPGIGVLTKELALRADKVVAIEIDKGLIPVLRETMAEFSNVKIINSDVMELDLNQLISEEFPSGDVVVCANLPYYITSPIIMKLLEDRLPIKSITAMIQKEAAERISAPMPSRNMGAITASIAYYAHSEILFSVSPGSFHPMPKVESSVIKLSVYDKPVVALNEDKDYFTVVRAAFSQRRKTLSNSLSHGLGLNKTDIGELLAKAEVSPTLRPEQLAIEDFANIANAFSQFKANRKPL